MLFEMNISVLSLKMLGNLKCSKKQHSENIKCTQNYLPNYLQITLFLNYFLKYFFMKLFTTNETKTKC